MNIMSSFKSTNTSDDEIRVACEVALRKFHTYTRTSMYYATDYAKEDVEKWVKQKK